jgi:hypothetical protein
MWLTMARADPGDPKLAGGGLLLLPGRAHVLPGPPNLIEDTPGHPVYYALHLP